MPYIIPNAIDTTSGNKYVALDQSEPDSIDFEVLGNSNSGVVSGCAVTPTTVQGAAVAVSGGVVVVNGTVYAVEPNTYLALPSPPSTSRFDMVIARVSGSTASLVCLYGTESAVNPALPKSKSRIVSTAGLNVLSYFDPDTDVVLATIYRFASNSITSAEIVDKRKTIQTPIPFRGPVAPQPTVGSVGDFYLQTGSLGVGSSGVYVKRTESGWVELANIQADPGVPIGSLIAWLFPTPPNPAVWIECNGAPLDPVAYPSLAPIINYSFGQESGTTRFYLPDLRGMYLAGLPTTGGSLATPVGQTTNSVTLTEGNMPRHNHTINHAHGNITTDESGNHRHIFTRNYFGDGFDTPGGGTPQTAAGPIGAQKFSNWSGINMTSSGAHQHTFNVPLTTNLESGFAGQASPTPVNIQPRTMYVKYYIRYA